MSKPNIQNSTLTSLGFSAALTTVAIKTSAYTASVNQLIPCDATSGAFAVTLPTAPADKSRVTIKKVDASTNAVTISSGGNDVFNITSGSTSLTLSLQNQSLSIQFNSSTSIWYVTGDGLPLGQLDAHYNAVYASLVSPALTGAPTINSVSAVTRSGTAPVGTSDLLLNIKDYGAKGDGRQISAALSIASSSTTLTTSSSQFTSADVGRTAAIVGAGSSGGTLLAVITSYASSTSVTLGTAAATTVSGVSGWVGTDDTTAIQTWVSYLTANGYAGWVPRGNYCLTAQVAFPVLPLWAIKGEHRGCSRFLQMKDNVPIFNLGASGNSYMHDYAVENIWFDYAGPQAGMTSAVCVLFSTMAYQGSWRGVNFNSGFDGMRVVSGVGGPWGTSWDDLIFGSALYGSAMDWSGAVNGVPNNHFGRMVASCNNMTKTVFNLRGYNTRIDTIECLSNTNGLQLFYAQAGSDLDIGSLKVEVGTYAASQVLFQFATNCTAQIQQITFIGSTPTVNNVPSNGNLYLLGVGGGTYGGVRVHSIQASSFSTDPGVSIPYIVSGGSSTSFVTIDNLYMIGTWQLQNLGSSASSEYITVGSYKNEHVSQDKGDANYTVALGDPNIIYFRTALTASRTVTLPSAGNNLFNGLYYTINAVGIGTSYPLIISNGSAILYTLSTDNTSLRFVWSRLSPSYGYAGWKLAGIQSLSATISSSGIASTKVEVFTSSSTWTPDTTAKTYRIQLIGVGGGGSSGARQATGIASSGGGGGAGASVIDITVPISAFPTSSYSVTVGAGGTGGAAVTADSSAGNAGTVGGTSIVGNLGAYGGNAGAAASTTAAAAAGTSPSQLPAGIGGGSSITASASNSAAAVGPGGGGGGGGISAAGTAYGGGIASPGLFSRGAGPAAGGASGGGSGGVNTAPGVVGAFYPGNGGGGGGAALSGTAGGAGGNASTYGGGGGGGGAAINGNASGAGGNGAPGIVIIISSY